MSRLIKKSIVIPSGVTVRESGGFLIVKGPKGEQNVRVVPGAKIKMEGADLRIEAGLGAAATSAATGTLWSLVKNAIVGVTDGFVKVLEVEGVGYRAVLEGEVLVLYLGYALPVRMKIPAGASVTLEKNMIKISGISKDLVGRVAAEIRSQKKPEPYKGKGIRYSDEVVRRKQGKKSA